MSDRDNNMNTGDLREIRSLIGDADGGGFSLDDILSEFGGHPPVSQEKSGEEKPEKKEPKDEKPEKEDSEARFNTIEWSKIPKPKSRPVPPGAPPPEGRVVAFPGARTASVRREERESPPEAAAPVRKTAEEAADRESGPAPVIPFPEKESALSAFLKNLGRKADNYADHMFEQDEAVDKREVRRLERLIPGTDREEVDGESSPRQWRRPRRQERPMPDTPPRELARKYGKGLRWMRARVLLLFLLALLSLVQAVIPTVGLAWPTPLNQSVLQCWISVALLGAGVLLGADALLTGLGRAFLFRFGMDTLSALACGFTLADGALLALGDVPPDRLPYSLVCLSGLFFLLHGSYHKRCALRLTCRTAASTATPYRVTLDPGLWSERDTYVKWSGDQEDFGSKIQADDGAQRVFRQICPLLLLGNAAFALMVSVGGGHPERLVWALSALFTATAAFGGTLAYGRSFHKAARRLSSSGAALAGWPGMAASRRGSCVLITDGDLFPPGYVELNGFKVIGDWSAERVVSYTATLIRDSGSGLTMLFHKQLRSIGGLFRRAKDLVCHEGGGLSANIRGSQVLVGSAAFMKLMEVRLPQGLSVKSAVFCAIDGELAGIFALNYTLPDAVIPSLDALMRERVEPVLATRDFNLIPAVLRQRFKLAADRMAFPPIERRRELSDPEAEHDGVLTALLCREGLMPFAEAVATAKRLRLAARLGAWLCCAGSVLGMLLCAYLTSLGAYTSLSPLSLLVYMLTWLAPVWFLSGWVHRF